MKEYKSSISGIRQKIELAKEIVNQHEQQVSNLLKDSIPKDIDSSINLYRAMLLIDEEGENVKRASIIIKWFEPAIIAITRASECFMMYEGKNEISVLEICMKDRILKLNLQGEQFRIIKTSQRDDDVLLRDIFYVYAGLQKILSIKGCIEACIFALIARQIPYIRVDLEKSEIMLPKPN